MNDQQLMAKIKAEMGAHIRTALAISSTPLYVSESFVASLAANESSGDPLVKRFEAMVFVDLGMVLAGRKPAYKGIGGQDLTPMLTKAGLNGNPLQSVTNRLMDLATSWGPTQIMGWHAIELNFNLSELVPLPSHFIACARLLAKLIREWNVAPAYPSFQTILFRLWNTGEPDGVTTDPNYVGKGLNRMGLYEALP